MTLADGSNFGPYKIIEPLGKGGMATVFKAYEAGLDRYVALKVLPGEFLHDETFAERFKREAKVIARLEHPNIIPIHAFGIEQGTPWMAMRLIPGGALSSILKTSRLEIGRVLAILRGAAEALDYASGKGVVHRDVKPQNILLDEAERVYLADFGIAKLLESTQGLTQTGMISGTPQYMAPEQAIGHPVDNRADVYALGIVAYEMLTGKVPFAADTPVAVLMKHVSEPVPVPTPAEVPEPLVRALVKALAKKPEDRWPKAVAFVKALEQGLAEIPTVPGSVVPTMAASPPGFTPNPPTFTPTVQSRPATPTMPPSYPSVPPMPPRPYPPPAAARPPAPPRAESGPGKGLIVAAVLGLGFLVVAGAVALGIVMTRGGGSKTDRPGVTPPPPTTIAGIPIEPRTPVDVAPGPPASTAPVYSPPQWDTPSPVVAPSPVVRPRVPPTTTLMAVHLPPPTLPPPPAVTIPPPAPEVRVPPNSLRFQLDTPIRINTEGPVQAHTVRFTTQDKGEKTTLRAIFPVQCPKGEWDINFAIELVDEEGRLLTRFDGGSDCENETKTITVNKGGLLRALVAAARGVRVRMKAELD